MRLPAFLFALCLAAIVAFGAAVSSQQPMTAPSVIVPSRLMLRPFRLTTTALACGAARNFVSYHWNRWTGTVPRSNPCATALPRRNERAPAFGWLIPTFVSNSHRRFN